MGKIKQYVLSIFGMILASVLLLAGVSALAYRLKWQAQQAMAGITAVYILTGFFGGVLLHKSRKEQEEKLSRKLLQGIFLGSLFMGLLLLVSFMGLEKEIAVSGRLLMIWMLLAGSAALGRIL